MSSGCWIPKLTVTACFFEVEKFDPESMNQEPAFWSGWVIDYRFFFKMLFSFAMLDFKKYTMKQDACLHLFTPD